MITMKRIHLSDVVFCIVNGDVEELVFWLRDGGSPEVSIQQDGRTLLHMAAECGNEKAVRVLLEHGADIHRTARCEKNVLYFAAIGMVPRFAHNAQGAERIFKMFVMERGMAKTPGARHARRVLKWVLARHDLVRLMEYWQ